MPSLYQFSETELLAFFLVLLRISAFIVAWPVFGVQTVPAPVKILLALAISLSVFPVVAWGKVTTSLESLQIVWLAVREIFIGLSMGFLARMFFYAINIAGEITSVSMGLANAQLFNPATETRSSTVDQFKIGLATLFFLAINGHHLLLAGLIQSFDMVPLSAQAINLQGMEQVGVFMQEIMEVGVQICAPVLVTVLFMNIAMAIVGRAVPQINVLITSLPVNILSGFLILIVALPLILWQMEGLLEMTATRLFQFVKSY